MRLFINLIQKYKVRRESGILEKAHREIISSWKSSEKERPNGGQGWEIFWQDNDKSAENFFI